MRCKKDIIRKSVMKELLCADDLVLLGNSGRSGIFIFWMKGSIKGQRSESKCKSDEGFPYGW